MATLVLGAVGAAIGSTIPGVGAAWGWNVGVIIGGMLTLDSSGDQEVGKLSDLKVTASSYGSMIPYVWGNTEVSGNIIWSTNLKEHVDTEDSGGKGGGGSETRTYSYSVDVAIAVARVITDRNMTLKKIRADDVIVWDATSSNNTTTVRFYNGSYTQDKDPLIASLDPDTPAYRGTAYVVLEGLALGDFGNRIPNLVFEVDTDEVTVGDVVSDLSTVSGVDLDDVDLSEAVDVVTGMYVTTRTASRDAISQILNVYSYDLVEVDGRIKIQKIGGAVVDTIIDADLGARIAGSGQVQKLQEVRVQAFELPSRIDVTFSNYDKKFEQGTQTAIRQTVYVENAETLSLGLVLTENEARQIAERELYRAWVERSGYSFALPISFMHLCTGDAINLAAGGVSARVKVSQMNLGMFGEIRISAVAEDVSILEQSVIGGRSEGGTSSPAPLEPIPAKFRAWSGKEFRAEHQVQSGFYVAATGPSGWKGCSVYWSSEGPTAADWMRAGTISTKTPWGYTTSVLPSGVTPEVWDITNTVDINLQEDGDLLASTSQALVENGRNVAYVGDELLGYATAGLTAPGNYTLSTLLRGLKSTTMSGHSTPEQFIHLTTGVLRVPVRETLVGETVWVKCVSQFETLDDVTAVAVTIQARSQTAIEEELEDVQTQISGRLRWREPWNSGVAYEVADVVSYNDALWVATTAGTNHEPVVPSAYWDRMLQDTVGGGTYEGVVSPSIMLDLVAGGNDNWTGQTEGSVTKVDLTSMTELRVVANNSNSDGCLLLPEYTYDLEDSWQSLGDGLSLGGNTANASLWAPIVLEGRGDVFVRLRGDGVGGGTDIHHASIQFRTVGGGASVAWADITSKPPIDVIASTISTQFKVGTVMGAVGANYTRGVILLHRAHESPVDLGTNFCIGRVVALRGDEIAYDRICIADVVSQSAYNTDLGTVNSTTGTLTGLVEDPWELVTCFYNSVKYVALKVPYKDFGLNQGAKFFGYLRSTAPESLLYVGYYDTDTSTALNAEINGSITPLASQMEEYHRGTVKADRLLVESDIGHLGGVKLDGLNDEARYLANSYSDVETSEQGAGGIFSSFRARGTKDAPSPPVSGDTLGRWAAGGWDSVLGGFRSVAYVCARASGTWSSTAMGSTLEFWVTATTTKLASIAATLTRDQFRMFGTIRADDGYQAGDGTPGASTTTGGATFKDGLYTGGTIEGGSGSASRAYLIQEVGLNMAAVQDYYVCKLPYSPADGVTPVTYTFQRAELHVEEVPAITSAQMDVLLNGTTILIDPLEVLAAGTDATAITTFAIATAVSGDVIKWRCLATSGATGFSPMIQMGATI